MRIEAPDIDLSTWLHELKPDHPLAKIVHLARQTLGIEDHPALELRVQSSIPVASGLGSGTAVSVAIARACGLAMKQHPKMNWCYQHEDRLVERELLPACLEHGVGLLPYFPLGVLKRPEGVPVAASGGALPMVGA